jgi:hypothetical protein
MLVREDRQTTMLPGRTGLSRRLLEAILSGAKITRTTTFWSVMLKASTTIEG